MQRNAPVFKLLRGRFWGFSPRRGYTLHRWGGWNLACRRSPTLRQISPPKLKFLLRFDQNVEYKRPAGAYPLSNCHKMSIFCSPFQDASAVKFSLDLLKGIWSYGGFKLTGSGYPQIFSALYSGKTMRQTPKVLEVQERARGPQSPCHVCWGSDFTRRQGGQKVEFFVCLSIFVFVRHAFFERQRLCARFRHEGFGVQKRFWCR